MGDAVLALWKSGFGKQKVSGSTSHISTGCHIFAATVDEGGEDAVCSSFAEMVAFHRKDEAMSIATTCPNCRAVYNLADHLRGRTVRCKKCQGAIVVGNGTAMGRDEKSKVAAIRKGAGASGNRQPESDSPKRPPRREQQKSSPQRKRKSNRALIVGLILGGVTLILLGGGVLAFLLLSGRVVNKASDLLVDVSGPWPDPKPFPAMVGNVSENTVVTIHIANVGDKYTREDVINKVHALTDGGRRGSSTGSHKGDRLTLRLTPVTDPQAFANKIDFATVRSVQGRIVTVVAQGRRCAAARRRRRSRGPVSPEITTQPSARRGGQSLEREGADQRLR